MAVWSKTNPHLHDIQNPVLWEFCCASDQVSSYPVWALVFMHCLDVLFALYETILVPTPAALLGLSSSVYCLPSSLCNSNERCCLFFHMLPESLVTVLLGTIPILFHRTYPFGPFFPPIFLHLLSKS